MRRTMLLAGLAAAGLGAAGLGAAGLGAAGLAAPTPPAAAAAPLQVAAEAPAPKAAEGRSMSRQTRIDGTRLLKLCSTRGTTQGCEAYIDGIADTISFYQRNSPIGANGKPVAAGVCVPFDATARQLREVVVSWLQSNTAERGRRAADIVIHVLRQTYPCA